MPARFRRREIPDDVEESPPFGKDGRLVGRHLSGDWEKVDGVLAAQLEGTIEVIAEEFDEFRSGIEEELGPEERRYFALGSLPAFGCLGGLWRPNEGSLGLFEIALFENRGEEVLVRERLRFPVPIGDGVANG